jgi:glutamate-5-semialdehyde dehydrogenase
VHTAADPDMARAIVVNAKMRRTGICGATETVLIDRALVPGLLRPLAEDLIAAGCEVRIDGLPGEADSAKPGLEGAMSGIEGATPAIDGTIPGIEGARPASPEDFGHEFLDAIVAIRIVDGIDEALAHIRRYGSGHTEAIVTDDAAAAERFLNELDSAILMHNASTQFADGGEFGMGAEIGIATGRIHARGPVGAQELTSYKYVVRGSGQTRP